MPTRTTPRKATGRGLAPFTDRFEAIVKNVETAIQGKDHVVRMAVICLLAEGHLLLEDVPGVGKTSLAKSLAASIDLSVHRIQFTPDLLPSDVTGVMVFNRNNQTFDFRPGGVFANIVVGDEINRASPKTQSALLEAMEELQVSVDATTHQLPRPFMVIATQNPIEHLGTYPLPQAQLDRFLMRISIGYPDRAAVVDMLDVHSQSSAVGRIQPVTTGPEISAMIEVCRRIHVHPLVREYLADLSEATRHHRHVAFGVSPRATLALQRAARARAASLGREFVVPDDVKALAVPVLAHRLTLTAEAEIAGTTTESLIEDILAKVAEPSLK